MAGLTSKAKKGKVFDGQVLRATSFSVIAPNQSSVNLMEGRKEAVRAQQFCLSPLQDEGDVNEVLELPQSRSIRKLQE